MLNRADATYTFPKFATVFGQSFICMSLPTLSFDLIAEHLIVSKPFLYDLNLPAFTSKLPAWALVKSKKYIYIFLRTF